MEVLIYGAIGFSFCIVLKLIAKDFKEKRYQKKIAARAAARRHVK